VKIGLLLPSTNTVAEPEYWELLPAGVTAHAGRMLVTQTEVGTDRDYLYLNDQMFAALEPTLANLLTCRPDHLALAMSAMSFVGGAAADPALRARLEEAAGVPVTVGPWALLGAGLVLDGLPAAILKRAGRWRQRHLAHAVLGGQPHLGAEISAGTAEQLQAAAVLAVAKAEQDP